MIDKLESLEKKYNDIQKQMSSNEVLNDYEKLKTLNEELKKITPIVEKYKLYKNIQEQIKQNEELLKDNELKELAKEEIKDLQTKSSQLIDELKIMLLPKDPLDEKDIILEIRAGTGGEEAALFAQDLFRMYVKYAENHNFKVEILEKSLSDAGGIKEIIANVKGKGAYSKFKFESGTHRVQRIPITESQGRIHTSAATVAVLPEADEIEVNINPDDLRIDVYRSSGSGGQHVNTTDSAVRITHIPTGIVVTCQDEKSQYKNKEKAMKILYARLSDFYRSQQESEIANQRKAQVGSGDRSERIRTYNFPQGRVTDHRINLTLYKLDKILEGELDELIESLLIADQTKKLTQMEG
ncbi:MAG: peptide chain release factor 1 [Desulfurella sp.]|uniref:peptide chain release factor 1 n=1 Tax=Desulfurella sp. TaxID=1962857 RepID=UPI0003E0A58D|nr:peptide chain release factor 1 [Desulfurella sp.]AHF97393.1 peptide chain release factor 1 [Desulfurella acetivorans A63]PMP92728.1 MAG: peptide chain release factor 1 [Desulfurella sp.]